jgi:phosphatidylserine/phosphatidylglycerophosphate/cardiolipin synthase-like enzyme
MIEPFGKPVRPHLERLIRRAQNNLLVATPFISAYQARWLVDAAHHGTQPPRLKVLTSINEKSVASGALEIKALKEFQTGLPSSEVINLPRLHAKVYIADSDLAVITSANLTMGGLKGNYEYGVSIESRDVVTRIRKDMEDYACIGNPLTDEELASLCDLGGRLRAAAKKLSRTTEGPDSRQFQALLRKMRSPVLEAQVGRRTTNAVFSNAVRFVLRDGPLSTRQIHPKIKELLPDLCDDHAELIINGQRFGKQWKHDVRNAQVTLSKAGIIALERGKWVLVQR